MLPALLPAQTWPRKILGVDFLVDGFTGEVKDIRAKDAKFVGDSVVIRVHRANLLNFGYLVGLSESADIVVTYGVVGLGTVTNTGPLGPDQVAAREVADSAFRAVLQSRTSRLKLLSPGSDGSDLAQGLIYLAQELAEASFDLQASVKRASALVEPVSRLEGTFHLSPCQDTWGNQHKTVAANFSAGKGAVTTSLAAVGGDLHALRERLQGYRLLVIATNTTRPVDGKSDLRVGDYPKLFDSLLTVLETRREAAVASIATMSATVGRWQTITEAIPAPVREFRFPVTKANRRQAIVIRRFPVSNAGKRS